MEESDDQPCHAWHLDVIALTPLLSAWFTWLTHHALKEQIFFTYPDTNVLKSRHR